MPDIIPNNSERVANGLLKPNNADVEEDTTEESCRLRA
jgi:hypothetical protein